MSLVTFKTSTTRGREKSSEHLEMPLYKTSTEKNINIDECFDELVDSLLEEIERGQQLKELNTLLLPASGQEDKAVHVNCCD